MPQEATVIESSVNGEKRPLMVALAGNPNSGKTTVFNALTNLRQKVGNYPGVTVEKKIGKMVLPDDRVIHVLDLPGTYSLAVRSPDEKVARDVLLGRMSDTPRPDIVICVVDASNLERNLYLVSQIQDLGLPIIVVLNMMDTAQEQGKEIDTARLSRILDAPVVPAVASQNKGMEELKSAILAGTKPVLLRRWRMPEPMEIEIQRLVDTLCECRNLDQSTAFSEALILISREDEGAKDELAGKRKITDCVKGIREHLTEWGINWRSAAIEARYDWIQKELKEVIRHKGQKKISLTDRLDSVLTHKIWGWLIFVILMAFMFLMIFSVATFPMDWIDHTFTKLSDVIKHGIPPGDLRDLTTDGIIAGVGAVVTFLPQILVLFFFIGLLQDTGYMARAAFIMDKLMSKVGLHGKSFIPLLSSFACAVPGIMATRTIESPKDRLVTILVAPLFSCSARLPIYTIMIATLIPMASVWQKTGIMLTMYLLGMTGAFVMAWFFKRTLLKSQTPVFIMELPPYRLPAFKTVLLQMWERSLLFLKRAGTIIFALSILMWALMTYPKHDALTSNGGLRGSFAGMIGTALEPAIKPLGYDWRIGIGLIGSFAAREVFISTMNIVFSIDGHIPTTASGTTATAVETEAVLARGAAESRVPRASGGPRGRPLTEPLRDAFKNALWPDGKKLFTPLACVSLMVFYVFAMQCLSTIAIVRRETNSWRWPAFQVAYMTGLAYVFALLVFQGGRMLGWQ